MYVYNIAYAYALPRYIFGAVWLSGSTEAEFLSRQPDWLVSDAAVSPSVDGGLIYVYTAARYSYGSWQLSAISYLTCMSAIHMTGG
jgi:hypothetical protein